MARGLCSWCSRVNQNAPLPTPASVTPSTLCVVLICEPVHLQAEHGQKYLQRRRHTGVFSENPPVEFTVRTAAGTQLQGSEPRMPVRE